MRKRVRKHRNTIISFITILAVMVCILSAKSIRQGRETEELVLFTVSAVWVVLFTVLNWKKLWKG